MQRFGKGYKGLSIIYITAFRRPVHIMRQFISNHDISKPSYAPYHRYKGLSSIPNLAGNKEYIPDNKYPIYKHYMFDMPDIRFERFDMKV
jgi:hypothetical protein